MRSSSGCGPRVDVVLEWMWSSSGLGPRVNMVVSWMWSLSGCDHRVMLSSSECNRRVEGIVELRGLSS